MPALLLIEDNERLAELLERGLTREGFEVTKGHTAADAYTHLNARRFDAMVLDLGLPDEDGLSVIRRLRSQGEHTPITVLTARGGVRDRVDGLAAGADDYLVKPVELLELAARIRAVLRRSSVFEGQLRAGDLTLDPETRCVFVGEQLRTVGVGEFVVLLHLLRRKNKVVTKEFLADQISGLEGFTSMNTIEVYIHRARKHLEEFGSAVQLRTIRGVGYIISDEPPASRLGGLA
jgi:DNA-binding response OmpR family regulator